MPGVPGLSLTGALYHIGPRGAIASSTARLPSSTALDPGMRHAMQVAGKPASLRLSVSNPADRDDWLYSDDLGAPRSVAFSAQMAF